MSFLSFVKRGLRWTLFFGMVRQAEQLLLIAWLARLLEAEDFGYYAVILIIMAAGQIVVTAVAAPYLIYAERLARSHLSAATWMSISASVLVLTVAVVGAPALSTVFGLRDLTLSIIFAAVAVLPMAVSSICSHYAYRRGEFKKVAAIDFISYSLGFGVVSIAGAFLEFGYFSLLAGVVAHQLLLATLYGMFFPVLQFRHMSLKSLGKVARYGGWLLWGRLAALCATQADKVVVSNVAGAAGLGLYSRAYQLSAVPADLYGRFGDKVLFSAFARIGFNESSESRAQVTGFVLSLVFGALLSFPMVVAPESVVRIVFGAGWGGAAPIIQLLAVAVPFRVGYRFLGTMLVAKGAVRCNAVHLTAYAVAIPVAALLAAVDGVSSIALAVAGVAVAHCLALAVSVASFMQWQVRCVFSTLLFPLLLFPFSAVSLRCVVGSSSGTSLGESLSLVAVAGIVALATAVLSLAPLGFVIYRERGKGTASF